MDIADRLERAHPDTLTDDEILALFREGRAEIIHLREIIQALDAVAAALVDSITDGIVFADPSKPDDEKSG